MRKNYKIRNHFDMSQSDSFIITEKSNTNPFAFFAWFAVRHQRSPKILFNRENREKFKQENLKSPEKRHEEIASLRSQ